MAPTSVSRRSWPNENRGSTGTDNVTLHVRESCTVGAELSPGPTVVDRSGATTMTILIIVGKHLRNRSPARYLMWTLSFQERSILGV